MGKGRIKRILRLCRFEFFDKGEGRHKRIQEINLSIKHMTTTNQENRDLYGNWWVVTHHKRQNKSDQLVNFVVNDSNNVGSWLLGA